jgi:hypothetical protein
MTQRMTETLSRHRLPARYEKIAAPMGDRSMGFTYSGARVAPLATDVHVRQEPDDEEEEEDEDDHKEEDDDDDDNGDGYSE